MMGTKQQMSQIKLCFPHNMLREVRKFLKRLCLRPVIILVMVAILIFAWLLSNIFDDIDPNRFIK
jgi:uncharacterized membrane protein (DUF106 family)